MFYSPLWGMVPGFGRGVPYPYYRPYPALTYPHYGGGWATSPAFWAGGWSGYVPYGGAWPMFAPGVQPGFPYGMTKEQEMDMLKNQAQMLNQQLEQINNQLEQINNRIQELEKSEK